MSRPGRAARSDGGRVRGRREASGVVRWRPGLPPTRNASAPFDHAHGAVSITEPRIAVASGKAVRPGEPIAPSCRERPVRLRPSNSLLFNQRGHVDLRKLIAPACRSRDEPAPPANERWRRNGRCQPYGGFVDRYRERSTGQQTEAFPNRSRDHDPPCLVDGRHHGITVPFQWCARVHCEAIVIAPLVACPIADLPRMDQPGPRRDSLLWGARGRPIGSWRIVVDEVERPVVTCWVVLRGSRRTRPCQAGRRSSVGRAADS